MGQRIRAFSPGLPGLALLLPPLHSFAVHSSVERWQLFFVLLAGVLISVLNEALHRARSDSERLSGALAQHRRELEELVLARTAELAQARDAAEAASRAKSRFLANMSHELRTPMNAIMGMTDLALLRAADPVQQDWLATSARASRQLLAIIDDILDISRIEAEQMALDEAPFSLARALDDCLRTVDEMARAKRLSVALDMTAAPPDALLGDAQRLRQIVLNLLAISRRLARLMGGDVGVSSDAGIGSRFWMTARLWHAPA